MANTVDLNGAVSGTSATVAFTEQTPVTLFPGATVTSDGNSNNGKLFDKIEITIAGATSTESLSLNAAAQSAASGMTYSYNSTTGVLTISGTDKADSVWQTILRGIVYNNTSDNPGTASRSLTVSAFDFK